MTGQPEQLVKKINTEQKFSDLVFKHFRSERFGITYCCPIDLEKIIITKELCDWQDLKVDAYKGFTVTETLWIHDGGTVLPNWGIKDCSTDPVGGGECIDLEATCFHVTVVDQNGNPIEGYPIYIDTIKVGITNANGILRFQVDNTLTQTVHTLNLCYCFNTFGNCNQIRFDIVADAECPVEPCPAPPEYLCEPLATVNSICTNGCTLPLNSVYVRYDNPADPLYGEVIYNVSQEITAFTFKILDGVCLGSTGGSAETAGFIIEHDPAVCNFVGYQPGVGQINPYTTDNYRLTFTQTAIDEVTVTYNAAIDITAYKLQLIAGMPDIIAVNVVPYSTAQFNATTLAAYDASGLTLPPGVGTMVIITFASDITSFMVGPLNGNILETGRIAGNVLQTTGGTGNGADMTNDGSVNVLDVIQIGNGLIVTDGFSGASANAWNFPPAATAAGNMSGADGIENLSGALEIVLAGLPPTSDAFYNYEDIYGSSVADPIPAGCGLLTSVTLSVTPIPTGISGMTLLTTGGIVMPVTLITNCLE